MIGAIKDIGKVLKLYSWLSNFVKSVKVSINSLNKKVRLLQKNDHQLAQQLKLLHAENRVLKEKIIELDEKSKRTEERLWELATSSEIPKRNKPLTGSKTDSININD